MAHVADRRYEPIDSRALARELDIDADDRAAFRDSLNALVGDGQIVIGAADTIALPPMGREVTGRFKRHERGFGFLIPDERNSHGDLFVPAPATGGAMTGDRVRARVEHRRRHGGPPGHSPYVGRVIEIIDRADARFVGELTRQGKLHVVRPDGRSMTDPIVVRDPGAKHARVGQKVVVELTQYPERDYLAEGVIVEVLGDPGEPDVETDAICAVYHIAGPFPDAVVEEARAALRRYEGERDALMQGRVDLREQYIITIDPPDAQDYDDAISITQTDAGTELGVHIADVATFVQPGTALDDEARARGNSTYLPRRVIPMLPEVLSNGICSLQPDALRLTRSAFITYDGQGNVVASRFARSAIQSAHRLTYLEAQALIDGDETEARKHARFDKPYSPQLIETVKAMDELAKRIRQRRHRDGMIVLDLPDVELIFDDDGRVIDAEPEDDAFTHKVIEAFMVEANEAVAREFAALGVPLLRRVHPDPGAHDVSELRVFAQVAGYQIPQNPTRKELQELIDKVRGTPAARAVHFAVLRTRTKAEYSPDLIGHFALASEHYTHFTSPIRRYCDLLVHRALDALHDALGKRQRVPRDPRQRKRIGNRLASDERVPTDAQLRELGSHCSATERNSEAAERELRTFLVLQLLEQHAGEIFDGTVTGVTGMGAFVQIDRFVVDGLIKLRELPGAPADQWSMNKYTGALTARRSGQSIQIGDRYRVQIVKVDLARREMDLRLVEAIGHGSASPARRPKSRKPSSKPDRLQKSKRRGAPTRKHKGQSKSKSPSKRKRPR